jgi:hypothetical protein
VLKGGLSLLTIYTAMLKLHGRLDPGPCDTNAIRLSYSNWHHHWWL